MKDTSRTAGDEAREIEQAKLPTMTVTTSLPQGVVLNNHLDRDGKPTAAANFGPGTPIEVKGQATVVPKDFWDAWALYNSDLVDRGVVSATPTREIERNEAEERANDGESVGSAS